MAVAAVDGKFAGVKLVAIRDGLNRAIADVRIPRGKEIPDARNGERRADGARDRSNKGEPVPPRREDLGQWLGLRSAGSPMPRPGVRDGTMMPHPHAHKMNPAQRRTNDD